MKKIFWGVAMVFGISMFGCSSQPAKKTWDDSVRIDGKIIQITDVDTARAKNVLHSRDYLPGGIFIKATDGPFGNDMPSAQSIIREIFIANNIRISDKLEDASMSVEFNTAGSINPLGQQMGALAAFAVGLTVGPAAAVGALAGAGIPTDEKTYLSAYVARKPELKQGRNGHTFVMSSVGEDFSNSVIVKYKLENKKEVSTDTILKLVTEQWIKHFLVLDTESAPVAESEAKK